MELDIEITPVEKFDVKINGKSIGEFERKSSWEGFVKLQNMHGQIIATDDRSFIDNIFSGIFNTENKSNFSVVKITPSLIPTDS
tara:strand:+ start:11243 stop:11494 length:252 start_codon:yes stop_codon:yes gene_type:complete